MIFTFWEVFQALAMTAIVGWIFKDAFPAPTMPHEYIKQARKGNLWWHAWAWSALLVAPSIILHELGHKFVALAFGLSAVFNAAWTWLFIGIAMKLIAGFVFFVPAYVSITGSAPAWVFALAALAGPAINFALWGFAKYAPTLRKHIRGKKISHKEFTYWVMFARINLFLGCFNLIPIPGFDGFQVIVRLISLF